MKAFFQSMSTRVFLVLFAGVLLTVALTLGLSFGERQRMVSQFRDFHAVERVTQFVQTLETVPSHLRAPFLDAAAGLGMQAQLVDRAEPAIEQSRLARLLGERMAGDYQVASTATRPGDCEPPPGRLARRHPDRAGRCEALLITLEDGGRVRLAVLPPRPAPLAPRIDPVYALLFLAGLGVLAAFVARMTMRPLQHLARAATELGHNIEREPLPEKGALEIRQAAAAFNAMQAQVRKHIRQRAHILAAITHDLQTPLTRMRLRLEKIEDAQLKEKLAGDVAAMQGMVREGLELVRSMESTEAVQKMDLDSLIDSVCDDASDAGQEVSKDGATAASVMARPLALRRCLGNLIDNAAKYGRRASVRVAREGGKAVIRIRDEGPGIPEQEIEQVFEPFYRVESSRSRHTGGTGLGLTIARNIAVQHGGAIQLRNHPEGGLEATLILPIA
ncbi:ATP-binding protein [Noviherbaspirillum aridicola]|uniref:histidine kinase n=1 Tax=Noviherbaspirillum aridicola TaxID=2849687 RepID=A0ABQ4Q3W9_9BURK|nr:ATP-binding protein [Noviherbaspirillum aridicola]GIZ51697.1 two-component sensor histidine kinase [Noviherbaspirillum aridicola]